MAPHVVVKDLVKVYPGQTTPSVDHVSFELPRGEMLALLGPSGCGKTTILRMIAGLIDPTSGTISIGGREIATTEVHKRGIGMVFQAYALFPHMSVAENVAFGLEMRGVPKAERVERVQRALDLVKLGDKGDRRITQLSGGQQQRAALARSLVIEPAILLLDEPLSNLDAKLRDEMRAEIRDIQSRTGITAIFVTHDQDEALSMADRVAVMSAGRIEQIGTPREIYDAPATEFVAGFIGDANFFNGRVVANERGAAVADVSNLGQLSFEGEAGVGSPVRLMVRPHRFDLMPSGDHAIAPGQQAFSGIVEDVVYTGDVLNCNVRVGPHLIRIDSLTRGTERGLGKGKTVAFTCKPSDVTVIPGEARVQ